jgi:RNA polymerase sigma factor (sigma-70 family)
LLERFLTRRDETAFEALVRRHGPRVLLVCRRIVGNLHDAEDAFQATFLILVRKAATLGQRELLGNWLYGVALRTARAARTRAARRRAKEKPMREIPQAQAERETTWQEFRPLLNQEVSRLPDKYRVPVTLCELEGRSRKEVALRLNLPEGTLSSRLAHARRLLARRLARRGVTLSGAALALAHAPPNVSAALPSSLVAATVQAAAGVASGAAEAAPASVVALMEGVLQTMSLTRLKIATGLLLAAALVGACVGLFPHQARAEKQAPPGKPPARPAPAAGTTNPVQKGTGWRERAVLREHTEAVLALSFGPKVLASAGGDAVRIWDLGSTKQEREGRFLPAETDVGAVSIKVGIGWVSFSPDGNWLAVGGREGGGMAMTNYSGGKFSQTAGSVLLEEGVPKALAPDGQTWAFADGKVLRLIETDLKQKEYTRERKGTCEGHTDVVHAAAFAPDSKLLATASEDRTVRLWDRETCREQNVCQGHTDGVVSLAFSPDGKTVASGGKDGTVRLWDAATGKLRATLEGNDVAWGLAFAPDGKALAAGRNDQTVEVWDVATGRRQATLRGHTQAVRAVAFSRDGLHLASAGDDTTIRLWELPR